LKKRKKKAELVIFPELSLTGYVIRDFLYEIAEPVSGPSVEKIAEIAKESNLYIVFGMPEKSEKVESVIYNTTVLAGPEGYISDQAVKHRFSEPTSVKLA